MNRVIDVATLKVQRNGEGDDASRSKLKGPKLRKQLNREDDQMIIEMLLKNIMKVNQAKGKEGDAKETTSGEN